MHSAVITNIQGYSIHDGPGIRTAVFIKGCPLRCQWCANPENLSGKIQVGFFEKLCNSCGKCLSVCPNGAISLKRQSHIDLEKCTRCGKCVDNCYYDAMVRYGEEKTASEVFDKVKRDKMFYDTSGGGVTVSGGEPLTKPNFVYELFNLCHDAGINTCIETCAYVPFDAIKTVIPVTDFFIFDLKIIDTEKHLQYTGVPNDLILSNARFLAESGAKILFRQPIISGISNSKENVLETVEFLKSLGRADIGIQLMPYHRMGVSKYKALQMLYRLEHLPGMNGNEIAEIEELYRQNGINCTVSK